MKKILFAGSVAFGLLLAAPVFAVATPVPSPTGTMMQVSPSGGNMMYQTGQAPTNMKLGMPCAMYQVDSGAVGMYRQMPCDSGYYQPFMGGYRGGTEAAWFGLMFIMTVILVWVVLLLLIGLLWKQLQKHK